ncbi:MAG: hypothetical protein JOS17DRAFT_745204 [Linnemannia elongata]|nr:MAG: hypothetical protein JOS17DRAFT_745204 [Linnemannia elongata]
MASQDNNNDDINAAYMNMLNRNIPGVGNNPLHPTSTTTTTKPTTTHLTNKSTNANLTSTSSVTKNQQHAIDTLQAAIKDALYISEGEEPYQTVHISTTTSGATPDTALTKNTSFPTEQEFVTLLQTTQLLPSFQQLTQTEDEDEDEDEGNFCEKSSNFQSILNKSNPGSERLAQVLHDVFGLPSTQDVTATTTTSVPENDKMVLYRVADPSSSTKVHIWLLGWIDGDLIGLHTISIES